MGIRSLHSYQDRPYTSSGLEHGWTLSDSIDFTTDVDKNNQDRCTSITYDGDLVQTPNLRQEPANKNFHAICSSLLGKHLSMSR